MRVPAWGLKGLWWIDYPDTAAEVLHNFLDIHRKPLLHRQVCLKIRAA